MSQIKISDFLKLFPSVMGLLTLALYLVGAFTAMSFDPNTWPPTGRANLALMWLAGTVLGFLFSLMMSEKEKEK